MVLSHSALAKLYLAEILSSVMLCRHMCADVYLFSHHSLTQKRLTVQYALDHILFILLKIA